MDVLLFGGTTEGRTLAEDLSALGVRVTLCVATAYGASLADARCGEVLAGRLDPPAMDALLAGRAWDCVVDATHPYAVEVTKNLRAAAERAGVEHFRLVREAPPGEEEGWLHAPDAAGAAALLADLPGNVLLTTGSKDLDRYAAPGLRERVFPRVLPSPDSLGRCLELGFPPAHVLCMQGPFSKELNLALIGQYGIQALVTKASGGAGGFWEKAAAAREAGIPLLVVDRPGAEEGLDYAALYARLAARGAPPL